MVHTQELLQDCIAGCSIARDKCREASPVQDDSAAAVNVGAVVHAASIVVGSVQPLHSILAAQLLCGEACHAHCISLQSQQVLRVLVLSRSIEAVVLWKHQ
jgi:hypothetical protein